MSDYIKREDAIKAVKHLSRNYTGKGKREDHPHIDFIIDEIKYEVPSADVAPVRHGRWMPLVDCSNEGIYCSACHKKVYRAEYSNTMKMHSPYCPNCGARMDGESDDD